MRIIVLFASASVAACTRDGDLSKNGRRPGQDGYPYFAVHDLNWLFNTVVSDGAAYILSDRNSHEELFSGARLHTLVCSEQISRNGESNRQVLVSIGGPMRTDWVRSEPLISYIGRVFCTGGEESQPIRDPPSAFCSSYYVNRSEMYAVEEKYMRCVYCSLPNHPVALQYGNIADVWCVNCFSRPNGGGNHLSEFVKMLLLEAYTRPSVCWFSFDPDIYDNSILLCLIENKYAEVAIVANTMEGTNKCIITPKAHGIPPVAVFSSYPLPATVDIFPAPLHMRHQSIHTMEMTEVEFNLLPKPAGVLRIRALRKFLHQCLQRDCPRGRKRKVYPRLTLDRASRFNLTDPQFLHHLLTQSSENTKKLLCLEKAAEKSKLLKRKRRKKNE